MPDLKEEFQKRFQHNPDAIFFSPGRVNLIGEHIDYNGGRVMPGAINLGTWLAVSRNNQNSFRFHCLNFPETVELPLLDSYAKSGTEWYNYPVGIIDHIIRNGQRLSGLDMLFYGNLPIGAGLSSSASIEVLTAFAIDKLFKLGNERTDLVLLAKQVENDFIGVNCGVMDQFAVAYGEKNKAILLDCDTLAYELLPFETGDFSLVIINTNKTRSLTDSKYNERFAECRAALLALQREIDIQNLCDLSMQQFQAYRHLLNDPALEKRALHVVSENFRVGEAVLALNGHRLEEFGQLMFASHQSLRNLYEVSGVELDTIVEFCRGDADCVGARMTGAGFGGCAIALVKTAALNNFSRSMVTYYKGKVGYSPEVFAAGIGDGVRQVEGDRQRDHSTVANGRS